VKIFLLGATGFLGLSVKKALNTLKLTTFCTKRSDFSFLKSGIINLSIQAQAQLNKADIVINCIAETNFENCRENSKHNINTSVPLFLQKNINDHQYLIHISTDAFYDSENNCSLENDPLSIKSEYAEQKLRAEDIVKSLNSVILRTSFVGLNHRNLGMVNALLNAKNKEINGWSNVFTSSVHSSDLVQLIIKLITTRKKGIFNFGTERFYSKYDFLCAVSARLSNNIKVNSINYHDDTRNYNCGMNSEKIKNELNLNLPTFESVVEKTITEINEK
jgi:dTDP-4-dehydrorhamnose reductase